MFRLGIIQESISDKDVLEKLRPYIFSQREEYVEDDECPHWHICEYHIDDKKIIEVADILKNTVKETWYIHAFNESSLIVVLKGEYFELPLKKDKSWNEMIKYGVKIAKVKKSYLKNIPLHI